MEGKETLPVIYVVVMSRKSSKVGGLCTTYMRLKSGTRAD